MPKHIAYDLRMYAFDEEQVGAGVPEVVEPYVGQPGKRLGGSAGGATVPYLPARTYAMRRTSISPSASSLTSNLCAVVAIGVGRRSVGRDNGARSRPSRFSAPHVELTGSRLALCYSGERRRL